MSDLPLKYLFVVEYADGSIFEQTSDDKSSIDPQKRSQFYDVLQSGKTIRYFSLVGDGHKITVDLGTGIFYVDGLALLLESEKLPTLPDRFTLVFYRQHTHELNREDSKELSHFIEYFIGWECEIAGKKYIQKLAVA